MLNKISRSNPIFQRVKELEKNTKSSDYVYVDDINVLKLALKYPISMDLFLYCDELEYHEDTQHLIDHLVTIANEAYTVSLQTFNSIKQKDNSVGLIAIIKLKTLSLNDLKDNNYLVVCDSLEIPGNLGTIYRTMDSAKCDGMILVDTVTKLSNPKLTSSARGCNLLIDSVSTSYQEALNWLLDNDYTIFLGEPNLGKNYQEYDYKGKIAIVVGSERFGINADWYNHRHEKVFIPMFGSNNSLNVGVAASILIYEATMKRKENNK